MKNHFRYYLYVFLVICSTPAVFSQIVDDCRIANWDDVVGEILDREEGICEYEVTCWSSPQYLELQVGSLLDSTSGVYHVQFIGVLDQIDLTSEGGFRPFEIIGENGNILQIIALKWGSNPDHEGVGIKVSSSYAQEGADFLGENRFKSVGEIQLAHHEKSINVQISWKHSAPFAQNGWVEFFVNGNFVGRASHLSLPISGPWAPSLVRYGSTMTPAIVPVGIFRILPMNPTPYSFHL